MQLIENASCTQNLIANFSGFWPIKLPQKLLFISRDPLPRFTNHNSRLTVCMILSFGAQKRTGGIPIMLRKPLVALGAIALSIAVCGLLALPFLARAAAGTHF